MSVEVAPADTSAIAQKIEDLEATKLEIELLSQPLLESFTKPLDLITDKLTELEKSQESLLSTISVESQKLESIPFLQNIIETLSQTGVYHQKTEKIKKSMEQLNDRMAKLKKRVEKLETKKHQDELLQAEKKEKELERERQLTAQPSKSLIESQNQNS